jgi:hypothetical protein
VRGETLIPHFREGIPVHVADYMMGWELKGQASIRKDNLKIVWFASPRGGNRWELFDFKNDPGETIDLSGSQSDVLKGGLGHWKEYKRGTGAVGLRKDVIDEMKDDTLWMKIEESTSWQIARQGIHRRYQFLLVPYGHVCYEKLFTQIEVAINHE